MFFVDVVLFVVVVVCFLLLFKSGLYLAFQKNFKILFLNISLGENNRKTTAICKKSLHKFISAYYVN